MRRRLLSAVIGLVAIGCVLEIVWNPKPLLVWNATASAPTGLYRRAGGAVQIGDWVLLQPPRNVAAFAAHRDYLPNNVPMIKRAAAMRGDTVCRDKAVISINGAVRALALVRDRMGRVLPVWQGCTRLNDDQIFVLNLPSDSFDGRYFGVVSRGNVIARIAPLWTF